MGVGKGAVPVIDKSVLFSPQNPDFMAAMKGVETHDAKCEKRSGWYNMCQLLMECVVTGHDELAMEMAEQFSHADLRKDEADDGHLHHMWVSPPAMSP